VLKEVKRRVDWDDEQAYPLISVRRRSEGAFHRETLNGSEILTKKLNYAYEGEFLLSKMQVVHGAMAVVPAALDGMFVSDSYLTFKSADEDRFDINFIGWLSTTQKMYKAVRRCSYGVHIEKMTFDLDMFLGEKLLIPTTREEQRLICDVLERAQAEIKAASDHLEQLKREKAALMSQLLTGKLRVKMPDVEEETQA
jgi:type I restriction enzyme S subunit